MSKPETEGQPPSWDYATLGEIGFWQGGSTPAKSNSAYWATRDHPWVTPKDMKVGAISDAQDYVSHTALAETNISLIRPGSVLLVTRSGILSRTLPVAVAKRPVTINQDLKAIIPHNGVDPEYVMWFCRFHEKEILGACSKPGTTVASINTDELKALELPVPPQNEQHRIVAKIEELFSELDKGVESLKTARAQLKTYRQSLLKAAFEGRLTEQWRRDNADRIFPVEELLSSVEKPKRPNKWKSRSKDIIQGHPCLAVGNPGGELPAGWRWVPLVDVARMESGHTPSRRQPDWWDGDIPWIGISDARKYDGSVIKDTAQFTNEEGLRNSAARLLPEGTVCVSRTASVGYVVEMGRQMATSQDFVNWVPTDAVSSAWLRVIFGAHPEYLMKFSKGTTHRTIYYPEWLSVHIGLPPKEEQFQIVDRVERVLSSISALEATLERELDKSDALRQSILKRAFEGKLVPQDPNDEPASDLLERIRQEQANASKPGRRKRKVGASA